PSRREYPTESDGPFGGCAVAIRNLKRILAAMRDLDDVERAVAAAEELSRQATREDIPRLRRLLTEGRYFLRQCLGTTLADLEGPPALPFLLGLLHEGTAENHDHDGLAHAITGLAAGHPDDVAPALLDWFGEDNPERRADAAWLAGFAAKAVPLA